MSSYYRVKQTTRFRFPNLQRARLVFMTQFRFLVGV